MTGWRGFVRFAVLVLAIGQVVSGLLIFWAVGLLVSSVAVERAARRRRRTRGATRRHPAGRPAGTGRGDRPPPALVVVPG